MMVANETAPAAEYELPLPEDPRAGPGVVEFDQPFPASLLITNALWFCRLRWIIVLSLAAVGLASQLGGWMERLALRPPGNWPFAVAGILALTNVGFLANIRTLRRVNSSSRAAIHLWVQIVSDLLILTAVVHFVGSRRTGIAFTYVFHIVLACIFFSRRRSLAVTLTACVLYVACITAEHVGVIPSRDMFSEMAISGESVLQPSVYVVNLMSAVGTWLGVWYLASHLSRMVQVRDAELGETNRRLLAAREERTRHMLTTTHQLKAPFAAIHANTQLLLGGYCGELPSEAREVTEKISARCRALATEIQEMLQLANLSSTSQQPAWVELDLAEILRGCLTQLAGIARERNVTFEEDLHAAPTTGAEDHLRMLLSNLLSNAIAYSRPEGQVRVTSGVEAGRTVVAISDDGIGIAADKLPLVFQEHYRTTEALRHNGQSSGLGLAIVRHVTQLHGIRLRVTSQSGIGTTFTLQFPVASRPNELNPKKENDNGIRDDCG